MSGAGSVPAIATTDNWKIDPSRSEIDFSLNSFTFAKTDGLFTKISGTAVRETESPEDMAFSATAVLNRKDFKIDYGPGPLIGDKVKLKLRLHLIHGAEDEHTKE